MNTRNITTYGSNQNVKTTRLAVLLAALWVFLLPPRAEAIPIVSFEPEALFTRNVSDPIVIKLNVSGLGGLDGGHLGAWLIEFEFNPLVMGISDGVVFGNGLNAGFPGNSTQFVDFSGTAAGRLHLDEISLLDPLVLAASQADSFTLATFNFTGYSVGYSGLKLTTIDLSDEFGNVMPFQYRNGLVGVGLPEGGSTLGLLAGSIFSVFLLGVFSPRGLDSFVKDREVGVRGKDAVAALAGELTGNADGDELGHGLVGSGKGHGAELAEPGQTEDGALAAPEKSRGGSGGSGNGTKARTDSLPVAVVS